MYSLDGGKISTIGKLYNAERSGRCFQIPIALKQSIGESSLVWHMSTVSTPMDSDVECFVLGEIFRDKCTKYFNLCSKIRRLFFEKSAITCVIIIARTVCTRWNKSLQWMRDRYEHAAMIDKLWSHTILGIKTLFFLNKWNTYLVQWSLFSASKQ